MKHKFKLGQHVWFLKSMRMCEVVELHGDGTYTVEVMDSGWRFNASEDELATLDDIR